MPTDSQQSDERIAALLHDELARFFRVWRNMELRGALTAEQLGALSTVVSLGAMSISELAQHERISPTTMSRIVSGLAKREMLKRRQSEHDGRSTLVSITVKGKRAYQRARRQRIDIVASTLRDMEAGRREHLVETISYLTHLSAALVERKILRPHAASRSSRKRPAIWKRKRSAPRIDIQ